MRQIALLLVVAACEPTTYDIADKISDHAGHLASRVVRSGGKFVTVEYGPVKPADCDELQHWVRDNVKGPPDCVTVECQLVDGSTDLLTSYEGIWQGGGGFYPNCGRK